MPSRHGKDTLSEGGARLLQNARLHTDWEGKRERQGALLSLEENPSLHFGGI